MPSRRVTETSHPLYSTAVLVDVAGTTVAWVPVRREFFALAPIAVDVLDAVTAGVSSELPDELVADVMGQLRDVGVFHDPGAASTPGHHPGARPGNGSEKIAASLAPQWQDDGGNGLRLGPFDALDHRFVVEIQGLDAVRSELGSELERVLAALSSDASACHGAFRYHVVRGQDGLALWAEDLRLDVHPSPAGVLATLLWDINRRAVAATTGDLVLHAGAVADEAGRAILLPAAMEAGKTTLVTALLRDGMRYLSDELAAVSDGTATVRPFSKALSLDPGSWPLFPELAPRDGRGGLSPHQWLVTADDVRPGADHGSTAPLGMLVFPRHAPGAATALHPLSPVEALVHLAACAFRLDDDPASVLPRLARLAEAVPAHRLTIGDGVHDAVSAVRQAVAELESTPARPGG